MRIYRKSGLPYFDSTFVLLAAVIITTPMAVVSVAMAIEGVVMSFSVDHTVQASTVVHDANGFYKQS